MACCLFYSNFLFFILALYNYPMKLVMYFGNDFIAAVDVVKKQVSQPGYIGKLKRKLMEENNICDDTDAGEVEFLLVNLTPQPGH
jgi:hypothetical protein